MRALSKQEEVSARAAINGVKKGVGVLYTAPPMTAVEHADENFYMSAESSYIEGKWKTVPYQIAILNAMGNDDIDEVNWVKSARVGYTKLLACAISYFSEHKKRNVIAWQPDDGARDDFSKQHIDPMIRDVGVLRSMFPHLGKKHKNNTIDCKVFGNQRQLHLKGGKAAKNYREKSVDVAIYDELSKFDADIEKEGSATFLGDKRLEGSVFRKSIRGSTPGIQGVCQIEEAAGEASHSFERYIPCPHCGEPQVLKFGGRGLDYGLSWSQDADDDAKPDTAHYVCPHNGCIFYYADYLVADSDGFYKSKKGLTTYDGLTFYDEDGAIAPTPISVAFHNWAIHSHFSPWSRIVKDWLKAKRTKEKLKSFVNTTLGETWEEDEGEKLEPETLYARREHYRSEVPVNNCVLIGSVDTQGDRFEIETSAWVAGEEKYLISYERLYGDLSRQEIWDKLAQRLKRQFVTPSGVLLDIKLVCIDSGGHYTDEVYAFSKKHGLTRFIPIKGASVAGKPIADFRRKRSAQGVYLTMIGTDTAKEIITSRLKIFEPGEGYIHFPVSDDFSEEYFKQLTNERKKSKVVKGRRVVVWDAGGRRNEPFDTAVYNLAGIRILQQNFGLNLSTYINGECEDVPEVVVAPVVQQAQKIQDQNYLGYEGDWI